MQNVTEKKETAVKAGKIRKARASSKTAPGTKPAPKGIAVSRRKAPRVKKPKISKGQPWEIKIPFSENEIGSFGYITAISAILKYKGEKITTIELEGLSGDPFRIFYSRNNRPGGTYAYPENPLWVACSALGYDYEYSYGLNQDSSWERLCEKIDMEEPVITPFMVDGEIPEWILITGIDYVNEKVGTLSNWGRKIYTWEEFLENWSVPWWGPTMDPSGIAPAISPYPMFTVGEKIRNPKMLEMYGDALKRAVKLMTMKTIDYNGEHYSGGFAAYEEMKDDMRCQGSGLKDIEELNTICAFNGYPLKYLSSQREHAAIFLEMVRKAVPDRFKEMVGDAAGYYNRAGELFERLLKCEPKPEVAREVKIRDSRTQKFLMKNIARERGMAASLVTRILEEEKHAIRIIEEITF
jgi:hypothetical protein